MVPERVDKLTEEPSVAGKLIDGIGVPGTRWSHFPSSSGAGRFVSSGIDVVVMIAI